jgi:hypothetical protein
MAEQVDGADKGFTGADLCFKEQAEFMVPLEVVDYLDDGTVA